MNSEVQPIGHKDRQGVSTCNCVTVTHCLMPSGGGGGGRGIIGPQTLASFVGEGQLVVFQ